MRRFLILGLILSISNFSYGAVDRGSAKKTSGSASAQDGYIPDFYVGLSLAPIYTQRNESIRSAGGSFGGEGDATGARTFGYDARLTLAGLWMDWLIFGLSYTNVASRTHRDSSPGGDTTKNAKNQMIEYGPTLGVTYEGWSLRGTWILSSKRIFIDSQATAAGAPSVNTITENTQGRGYQLEFSYSFLLTESLGIGPNLVYRKVVYDYQTFTDAITPGNSYHTRPFASKAIEADWSPMLLLTYVF